jgi:hypothetical protein
MARMLRRNVIGYLSRTKPVDSSLIGMVSTDYHTKIDYAESQPVSLHPLTFHEAVVGVDRNEVGISSKRPEAKNKRQNAKG